MVPPARFKDLYRQTYGRDVSPAVFEWKYAQNPHGKATVWAATEGGSDRWLGAVALLPRRFRYQGRLLAAGQIADLMVAPAARRRGIFRKLMDCVWQEHPQFGYDLLFTLPQAAGMSVGGFASMEFLHDVGRLRDYARLLRPEVVVNRYVPTPPLRWIATRALTAWLAWLDRGDLLPPLTPDRAFTSDEDGFVVDEHWVQWRIRAPGTSLRSFYWPAGGAIVAEGRGFAEIYTLRGAGVREQLRALLFHLKQQSFGKVLLGGRLSPELLLQFRTAGFLERRNENPLVCYAGSHTWDDELMRTLSTVSVTRADLDVP